MNSKSNISGPTYGQPSSQKSKNNIISSYTPSLLSSDNYGKSSQGKRQYPTQEPIVKTSISTPYAGQRSNNLDMNKFTLSNNTYLGSTPSKQQPSTNSGSQYNQQSASSQCNQQQNKQSQQQFQSKSESYQSPFQNSAPLYSQTIQKYIQPQISDTTSYYPPNDLRPYNQLQQQSNIMNHQINSNKNYMKDEIKPSSNKIPYERETNTIQKQLSTVGIAGLRNIGNTCFMNSVLQCIMNTPRFNDSFINRSFTQQLHPKNKGIATEYSQLIQKVRQSPNFSSENTNGLKRAIELQSPQFAGYDQQDAQEFMIAFLEGINQDMNRVTTKSPYKEMNDDLQKQSVQKLSQDWWDYQKSREHSIIQDYFMGQLLNKVICQYCQKESLAFDAFIDIQLSISRSQTILDDMELERLIDLFLKEEQLDEAFCSKWQELIFKQSKKLQKSKRKFLIWRLPNILIFTIKRFNFRRFGSGKLSNKIKLPIKNLDLCNLVKESSDPSTKNCQYELYGIVNHSGTLSSGHYTADCKSPIDEKWYRFNDSNVREIDITHQGYETNGSSDPYIIFYRRKQL